MIQISDAAKQAITGMCRYIKYKVVASNQHHTFDITDYVIDINTLDELTLLDTAPFGGVSYNELVITLDNISGVFNNFATQNSEVSVHNEVPDIFVKGTKWHVYYLVETTDNVFEDILGGVYYFDNLTCDSSNYTATCTCYDKLFSVGSLPINKFGVAKDITLKDAYTKVLLGAGFKHTDIDLTECPDMLLPIFWGVGTTLSEILTNLSNSSATNIYVDKEDKIKVVNSMGTSVPVDTLSDDVNIVSIRGMQPYINTYSDIVVTYDRLVNSIISEVVTLTDIDIEPGETIMENIVVQETPIEDIIGMSIKHDSDIHAEITGVTDSTVSIRIINSSNDTAVVTIRVYANIIQTVSCTHTVTNSTANSSNVLQIALPIATTDAYAKALASNILQYFNNMLPIIEIDTRANPAWELNDILTVTSDVSNIKAIMRIISIDAGFSSGYSGVVKLMEVH